MPRTTGQRPVQVLGLDHVVLRVADIDASLRWYEQVFGSTVERQIGDFGLYQLRVGKSLIDLVPVRSRAGRAGGGAPGKTRRNMDHFAVRLAHFDAPKIRAFLKRRGIEPGEVTALYVGNMMAGILGQQQQLGPLYADVAGLRGVESMTLEAACGSGSAAVRVGYSAVAGGLHDVVVVCGMERMTQAPREDITMALATAADWELEGVKGESFISLNAGLMAHYMEAYDVSAADFAPFAIAAHSNAMNNPNALLHKPLDLDTYLNSRMLVPPVRLMDAPPTCDGSAAIVLVSGERAKAAEGRGVQPIRIAASAVGTDSLAIDRRVDKLTLSGARLSTDKAYTQAGLGPAEVHDLSLNRPGAASGGGGSFRAHRGRGMRRRL